MCSRSLGEGLQSLGVEAARYRSLGQNHTVRHHKLYQRPAHKADFPTVNKAVKSPNDVDVTMPSSRSEPCNGFELHMLRYARPAARSAARQHTSRSSAPGTNKKAANAPVFSPRISSVRIFGFGLTGNVLSVISVSKVCGSSRSQPRCWLGQRDHVSRP